MKNRNCGVCNREVLDDEEQLMKSESNGSVTSYHIGCEYEVKSIPLCEVCGEHRLLCNECGEPPFDS